MISGDDKLRIEESLLWAKDKANWKPIVISICDGAQKAKRPLSIFMAGSPGAGKTEFSKGLISSTDYKDETIVRIDPDELRSRIPLYIPGKSELMNSAVSILIEKVHDHAQDKGLHFILDGTLSHLDIALKNVKRSLDKGRTVIIYYIYQDPLLSWTFTQKRERIEGRNIPKDAFISEFFDSRNVVATLKDKFKDDVTVLIVDRETGKYLDAQNSQTIDNYMADKYTIKTLTQAL